MPLSTQSQSESDEFLWILITFMECFTLLYFLSRLSTFGNSGNAHYDYPKDSDMMELFQCTKTQKNRYKMSLLKPSTKALGLSCKVSVRTDSRGFLSLQYLVRNDDGQICFVEYYCCPDEEVDEE
uniref:Uncharacterized protein n=1 Tax=Electrophorus electricus TaxID=8005 RepID=A0A4W4HQ42_ELEEL